MPKKPPVSVRVSHTSDNDPGRVLEENVESCDFGESTAGNSDDKLYDKGYESEDESDEAESDD